MTFTTILAIALCSLGIVLAFFSKLPAAAVSFVGMLLAGLCGQPAFVSGTLWFWGIAAAIVTANMYLTELPPLPVLRYYTLGGCLTGVVVGAAVTVPQLGTIVGGFIGAVIGFMAFRGTPSGRINASITRMLAIFADVALPGFVAFCISVITLFSLI